MRAAALVTLVIVATGLDGTALAHPDGAPWGAALPAADQNCAACHFGDDPVHDSAALGVRGLPATVTAGETYLLTIRFVDPAIVTAGFQLIAATEKGQAGTFSSLDPDVETSGTGVRSTVPAKAAAGPAWRIAWHAPEKLSADITFYLAASAANDDRSPFGDTIHFRSFSLPVGAQ